MGYRRKTYKLVFADEEFDGLEVRTRGGSIDHLVQLTAITQLGAELVKPAGHAHRDEMYQLLAGRLLSWNLEDDQGQPVPVTVEALRQQDWPLVLGIAHAWMSAVAGVSRPLDSDSPSGQPFPEASIPMEVSLPSPPS